MKRKKYTKADEGFIVANFQNYTDQEFADIFGVSVKAFQQKRRKLGYIGRENSGKFQKGHKNEHPMPPREANSGSFKKGNKPHNTREIGYQCKHSDGYTYVKTENGMELLQRVVYKLHYGNIPEGYIVIFKDNNHDDFAPDNLEAISRTEHLRRNRNYEKASETMKLAWAFAKERAEQGDFRMFYRKRKIKI
jgi:hypothetical protein